MAVSYKSTRDPREIAENQRALTQNRGDELNQQNQDLGNQAANEYQNYSSFLNPIEMEMAAGNGGYNENERAGIMQAGGAVENYLTPEEQKAASGDTSSFEKYFNPDGMTGAQSDSASLQRGTAANLQSRMDSAIDPSQLAQSGDYRARARGSVADNKHDTGVTIDSMAGNVRGAIGDEAGNVRGAIDPSAVTASQAFLDKQQMTPEEQQDIVTGAGISEGVKNQAAVGDLQRKAAAAGASPMGVAAYRARMNRESAGQAGDAMTKARIDASNAAADRSMRAEQLREQGGQYLTNTKVGSELNLGQQRANAEQGMGSEALGAQMHLGDQALGQANTEEQNRQAAQQYLTGAQLHSAEAGGEAALNTEGNINNQQRQQQQFNTTQGTNIAQAQDQASAQRALALGQNRQGVSLTNQNNASNRTAAIGNQRVAQQNVGLGAQTQQAQTQNTNAQNAQGRQLQGYGIQSGGTNQAAGLGLAASQTPSTFDKVLGGISGAAGAAAAFLDEGGVVTKPTLAIVGEHGPEMVTPLGYRAQAKSRPSVAFGQEKVRGRRMYGEAA
jgi:hypothetical protein